MSDRNRDVDEYGDAEADEESAEAPADSAGYSSGSEFTRCPHCRMEVRRSELSIHLAYAHNIGPHTDRKRSRRSERRD